MEKSNTKTDTEARHLAVPLDRLVRRLRSHIAMMAPHQKERDGGKLILESYAAIEELRQTLIGYIPRHSGLCCELVDGQYRVTAESCACPEKDKRARELTEHDLPLPNAKVSNGEKRGTSKRNLED